MKYYTENSQSILKLRRQLDADYIKRLRAALDSKIDGKYAKDAASIFSHTEFVRAFYAPKNDAGEIKTAFLLSVSPIIVSRIGKVFEVSYVEPDGLKPEQKTLIERDVMGENYTGDAVNLTIEGNKWTFSQDVNLYNLTRTARKQLPSFNIIDMTHTDKEASEKIYVCYFGDLEKYDETLINKTTGVNILKREVRGDGLYKFTFNDTINLSDYGTKLKTIANTNKNDFRFVKRDPFKYEDVNYTDVKIDLGNRKAILTILMRDKSESTKDIAADLSMNLDSGINMSETTTTLMKEFDRISNVIKNGTVFGNRYILSEGNN